MAFPLLDLLQEESFEMRAVGKTEMWLQTLLKDLQVNQTVNLSDFRSRHDIDRGTFGIVLATLQFIGIITIMGKNQHKAAQLKSTHRLSYPIDLSSILNEIHMASQQLNQRVPDPLASFT